MKQLNSVDRGATHIQRLTPLPKRGRQPFQFLDSGLACVVEGSSNAHFVIGGPGQIEYVSNTVDTRSLYSLDPRMPVVGGFFDHRERDHPQDEVIEDDAPMVDDMDDPGALFESAAEQEEAIKRAQELMQGGGEELEVGDDVIVGQNASFVCPTSDGTFRRVRAGELCLTNGCGSTFALAKCSRRRMRQCRVPTPRTRIQNSHSLPPPHDTPLHASEPFSTNFLPP